MPSTLIVPGFLAPGMCRRVRLAMDAGVPEPAEVLEPGAIVHDGRVRRAAHVEVDAETLALLERALDGCRATLERRFSTPLGDREGASLLRYRAGDFFRRHRDRGDLPSWPAAARRLVSVVLFLTSSRDADPAGTFEGGVLDLADEDGRPLRRITPVAGTLVAFPSDLPHEVTRVLDGTRDTVVDWFHAALPLAGRAAAR